MRQGQNQIVKEFKMLVLSRHAGESIMIGDNIRISISYIRGDKVGIAIEAPKEMPVHRQEVYDRIKLEGKQ
jgi:carbon storage regulator